MKKYKIGLNQFISKLLNTQLKEVNENSNIKIRTQNETELMSLNEYFVSIKKYK